MIYESTRKMSVKEQEAYDLGYLNGKEAALRSHVPDPATGIMRCGCGGSAAYHISYDDENWSTTVKVACNKCLIHVIFSALYELRGEEALADDAKRAWNTAMSGGMCNHEN